MDDHLQMNKCGCGLRHVLMDDLVMQIAAVTTGVGLVTPSPEALATPSIPYSEGADLGRTGDTTAAAGVTAVEALL
jgi:hypothetical protein